MADFDQILNDIKSKREELEATDASGAEKIRQELILLAILGALFDLLFYGAVVVLVLLVALTTLQHIGVLALVLEVTV